MDAYKGKEPGSARRIVSGYGAGMISGLLSGLLLGGMGCAMPLRSLVGGEVFEGRKPSSVHANFRSLPPDTVVLGRWSLRDFPQSGIRPAPRWRYGCARTGRGAERETAGLAGREYFVFSGVNWFCMRRPAEMLPATLRGR